MQNFEFFNELLELRTPWQVADVSVDQSRKRVDIHLGFKGPAKKSLFGFASKKGIFGMGGNATCPHCQSILPKNGSFKTISVRHLSVADFITYLHIPSPGTVKSLNTDCVCMQSWMVAGTRCTPAFYDYVLSLLHKVSERDAVTDLISISAKELQEIIDVSDMKTAAEDSGVPELHHPNWRRLVSGEITIQPDFLALNMLLRRVRASYEKSPSAESSLEGAKVLRQFFLRNQKMLKVEIEILSGRNADVVNSKARIRSSVTESNLPDESALVWQKVASGELSINTKQIGLQMLLSQMRKSLMQNPDDSNREAYIRKVRNCCIKNREYLKDEIAQLASFHKYN